MDIKSTAIISPLLPEISKDDVPFIARYRERIDSPIILFFFFFKNNKQYHGVVLSSNSEVSYPIGRNVKYTQDLVENRYSLVFDKITLELQKITC